jgi:hypothetical protein
MELAIKGAAALLAAAAAAVAGANYGGSRASSKQAESSSCIMQMQQGGASTPTPTPRNVPLRMHATLAMDEAIDPSGKWSGFFKADLPILVAELIPKTTLSTPVTVTPTKSTNINAYTELLRNATTLLAFMKAKHDTADDCFNLVKTERIVVGGFEGHAIGFLFRRIDKTMEVAVVNSGLGCDYHGAADASQIAGIIVFKPVCKRAFFEFIQLAHLISFVHGHNNAIPKELRATIFYRVVLDPLINSEAYTGAAYTAPTTSTAMGEVNLREWTLLNAATCTSAYFPMPVQSTGDCMLRALLFAGLASPDVVPRAPGGKQSVPVWFWKWYAEHVATSATALLNFNYEADIGFTQAEFCSILHRLRSLQSWLRQMKINDVDFTIPFYMPMNRIKSPSPHRKCSTTHRNLL